MAENSAHLAANLQNKPSLFEVVAVESLAGTFYPAFERIIQYLVLRNPEKYGFLEDYYDEIFLVANGVIQHYYLKSRGGTLSEVFYGLRRFSTKTNDFSRKDHIFALFCTVLLPYLRGKADSLINMWREDMRNGVNVPRPDRKKLYIRIHGAFVGIHECLKIAQYLAYLSGYSKSHTPLFRATNQALTYAQEEEDVEWTWMNLLRGQLKISTVFSELILKSLEFSAFFIQFLQWWQTEAHHTDLTSLPTPSFPVLTRDFNYQDVCPVCLGKWTRPTCCAISGYIYCYKCIVTAIERTRTCPASKYPISIDDIFLLYDD